MIEYRRFNPRSDEADLFEQLVGCYQQVFASGPWNEWCKCQVCNTKWGIDQNPPSVHCGMPVVEFWPADVVRQVLVNKVTNEATCWLALADSRVAGFTCGYPTTPEKFENKVQIPCLARTIQVKLGPVELVGYLSEVGVLLEYRSQKIARMLHDLRQADFRKQGLTVDLAITMTNPPTILYLWYTKLGYQVIAGYGDPDGRVILAGRIN